MIRSADPAGAMSRQAVSGKQAASPTRTVAQNGREPAALLIPEGAAGAVTEFSIDGSVITSSF